MARENDESAESVVTTAGNIYRQARDQAASRAEYDVQAGLNRLNRWMSQDEHKSMPRSTLSHYRAILALDIERSTSRPDPVKAEIRRSAYELFETALRAAGIHQTHHDRFVDRGDGILALIHPADQVPSALLLSRVVPILSRLLAEYNASVTRPGEQQRQLRIRVVVHAGEVYYDANGCYGEALDVAFRLLDAAQVKRALRDTADPLITVVSADIYNSIVRHGYDDIDNQAFHPRVRVQVAGRRYSGWIHIPEPAVRQLGERGDNPVSGLPVPPRGSSSAAS